MLAVDVRAGDLSVEFEDEKGIALDQTTPVPSYLRRGNIREIELKKAAPVVAEAAFTSALVFPENLRETKLHSFYFFCFTCFIIKKA